ncbi:unnamed protein product [Lupinus luteus]|uniref:Uncharacterized protein n=1 Tax=Lupinus luteus TaxID=3873 RepID=A0AAV1WTI7_LUPLU
MVTTENNDAPYPTPLFREKERTDPLAQRRTTTMTISLTSCSLLSPINHSLPPPSMTRARRGRVTCYSNANNNIDSTDKKRSYSNGSVGGINDVFSNLYNEHSQNRSILISNITTPNSNTDGNANASDFNSDSVDENDDEDGWNSSLQNRSMGYDYMYQIMGNLVAKNSIFPFGIKAPADYVHNKGLKLGIYSDAA